MILINTRVHRIYINWKMKRILNACLFFTSLFGYLQWGKDKHAFIFQLEYELFLKIKTSPQTLLHPLILLPLCGQLLILFTLFQKTPGRAVSLIGLACISIIMLMLLLVGIVTTDLRIALSSIPFIITGVLVIKYNFKK